MRDHPDLQSSYLYAELSDILRTMPVNTGYAFDAEELNQWCGRAVGTVRLWDMARGVGFATAVADLRSSTAFRSQNGYNAVAMILHEALTDLRLRAGTPTSVAIETGSVHQYFDTVRKYVEEANTDLLFVDRFLEADFCARFLPFVRAGVTVRLLTRERIKQLLPAVETIARERSMSIEVRSFDAIHDRWLFIDRTRAIQSGASFKDGGKSSHTTLSEAIDKAPQILASYEADWLGAKLENWKSFREDSAKS